jgi:DNA invertase Pin-like site-specific DNA recombinase
MNQSSMFFILVENVRLYRDNWLRARQHAGSNLDLQVDVLKRAGCERVYQDVAGGTRTVRPALDEILSQLRAGDVLVIWKLDRMGGRSRTWLNWWASLGQTF